ncbi:MAG: hypothetical protein WA843_03755 [Candidatus Saccharimonadales bacterium]
MPSVYAAGPFICTWTGGGSDNNFNTAGNWSGCNSAAPQPADNDQLVFPISAARHTPINNLTSASFANITFNGGASDQSQSGYTITGNAITLGNIDDSSNTSAGNEINVNITVNSSVLFSSSSTSGLTIGNPSSPGSTSLTVVGSVQLNLRDTIVASAITAGSGSLIVVSSPVGDNGVFFAADNPGLAGNVRVDGGTLNLYGQNVNATVTTDGAGNSKLGGTAGQAKQIIVGANDSISPGLSSSPNCLTAGSLTLSGVYNAKIQGSTTACTDYDQIVNTSGQVNLSGSRLNVSFLNSFEPAVGTKFTIIKNQFGGPISGTFSGLAEGGTFTVGDVTFSITYQGNSENDVVITVTKVGSASAKTTPSAPNTGLGAIMGNPFSLLATTGAAALMILIIARRLKPAVKR